MRTVKLPLPDRGLSPNARLHYHAKAQLFALAKKKAEQAAIQAGFAGFGGRKLKLVFVLPNKRRRDLDNLHAAMKAALDGIAKAVGCDDSEFCPIVIDRVYGNRENSGVIVELSQ